MTTTADAEIACAVCGTVNTVEVVTSSNVFGSPGLDFRPPPMFGDTVDLWVQECSECGFVAMHLAAAAEGIKDLVLGEGYQQARRAWSGLERARKFYLLGWLAEQRGKMTSAFTAYLNGAWCCDRSPEHRTARFRRQLRLRLGVTPIESPDSDQQWDASGFRRNALRTLEAAQKAGRPCHEDPEAETAVTIDLYRRIGAFDQARMVAEHALAEDCSEDMRHIAGFQKRLIDDHDDSEYTFADVHEWVADGQPQSPHQAQDLPPTIGSTALPEAPPDHQPLTPASHVPRKFPFVLDIIDSEGDENYCAHGLSTYLLPHGQYGVELDGMVFPVWMVAGRDRCIAYAQDPDSGFHPDKCKVLWLLGSSFAPRERRGSADGYINRCHNCKTSLNADMGRCGRCGWIECPSCGACGCSFAGCG